MSYIYKITVLLKALLLWLGIRGGRQTIAIHYEYEPKEDLPPHAIYTFWHCHWIAYFMCFQKNKNTKDVIMVYPASYMKPVHVFLKWIGYDELFMGASGKQGKKALQEICKALEKGANTVISPDGPYGPPLTIRKGVGQMAYQTGLPIIPIKFVYSSYIRLPSWDRKFIPMPFSRIKVRYGTPIYVRTEKNNSYKLDLFKQMTYI